MAQSTIVGSDLVKDALKTKSNDNFTELYTDFAALVADYITGAAAETKTDDYTITTSDFGKTIRMNSVDDKTFTFPSVGSSHDGKRITLGKINTGKVTFQAADTDKVADSDAGGAAYNDVATEVFANFTFEYVHATTTWNVVGGHGTLAPDTD